MLTLIGFYHLVPRPLRPLVCALALLAIVASVAFSLITFSSVLKTAQKPHHQHDPAKSHQVKEAQ